MTLPSWYNDEDYEELTKVTSLYLDSLSGTPELNKLNGGTITRKFVENMNFTDPSTKHKKLYLYSGHDKTVYAFIKAHNLTMNGYPAFGSAVIVEKLRDSKNNSYIKVFYNFFYYLYFNKPKKNFSITNCFVLFFIYFFVDDFLEWIDKKTDDIEVGKLFRNLSNGGVLENRRSSIAIGR